MEEEVEQNTGEEVTDEAEQEEPTVPITPTGEEKTTPTGAYGKLNLTVTPVVKSVPDIPHVVEDEEKEVKSVFTKEDARFFGQMIWALPPSILGEHMKIEEKLVNQWSDQLFSYCERKGLNLYDYMFDELGLVMSTGVIVTSLVAKHRQHKKEEKEKEEKEEKEKSELW